jgi:manganese/iron transport system permease protein
MIDWLLDPLDYPFMQRALVEVAIVGVVCGLVGCFVVLRGLAFIGDALAHAVFPGVVLSYLADRSILLGAFVFGTLTSLGIGFLSRSKRVSEDSAIGVLFVASFAFGVVLVSRQSGFRRDLSSLLFGNILGVSHTDVIVTLIVGGIIVVILLALLKEFTLVAFDSTMARAVGYPVFALDILLLLLVSATIVVSLQTVGNILVLALIVTPPATARLLTDRLSTLMALSALLAVLAGVAGLYISFHAGTAGGATIVLCSTAMFLLALFLAPNHGLVTGWLQERRGSHHVHHYHPPIEEEDKVAPRSGIG